jgi:hypothetical protein
MTNDEIVRKFVTGNERGTANSMYIEKHGGATVLYSYGYHFPMLIRTSSGFFFNTSKYSRTTSRQQSICRKYLEQGLLSAIVAERNTEEMKSLVNRF